MSYLIAWIVLYIVGGLFLYMCFRMVRRFSLMRWYLLALGGFWMLTPWSWDGEHWAPMYIVILFQFFLEREADYSSVVAFAFLGSVMITIAMLIVATITLYFRVSGRMQRGNE